MMTGKCSLGAWCLAIAVLLVSLGCRSSVPNSLPFVQPAFFEEEVRSRTWTAPDGTLIEFLGSTNLDLQGHTILLAQFGDMKTKQIRCLEVYEINRKEDAASRDTFVLLNHDWGPREQSWWQSEVMLVEPLMHDNATSLKIIRHGQRAGEADGKSLLYFLDYRPGIGVSPNMSEWWVNRPQLKP
jgi:hypothetical protein